MRRLFIALSVLALAAGCKTAPEPVPEAPPADEHVEELIRLRRKQNGLTAAAHLARVPIEHEIPEQHHAHSSS